MKGVDDQKAALLEKQILDLWDRVYQAWMMSSAEPSVGPSVSTGAVFASWDNFMDGMQKTPGITSMILIEWVTANVLLYLYICSLQDFYFNIPFFYPG
jgi:hypothetical protein